ncbi:TonB-dependent receptor plug domain-containing protein [Thiosulfativibrio zosterae]|uniref:Vitamin B12 transporter BtuB n=1 Tax=Thiosulfativibrio zosterae TaxID=2675053 RepID=A0A6F8PNK5_9GAMM|nr:TonB-dependent receptor [Thiosulfativibrio zosterae]BBP43624.1 vitamin B12 transporter BtuB [Thiosulfativibrio zosterae]
MKLSKLSLAILATLNASAIYAETSTTQLSQVVVTANNTEQPLSSVTANTTIITAEEIAEKQYKTLDEALKQVPGIFITNQGGLGKQTTIFMRGETGKRILFLQDGVELNDPTSVGGTHVEALLLDDVERIEIIKGAQSSAWGSGAMAGVINIITKKPGQKAQATISAGSYGYQKLTTTLGAGNEKVDFVVNLTDVSSEGFTAIKDAHKSVDGYEADPYSQTDISFKMGINPTQNQRVQLFVKQSQYATNIDFGSSPSTDSPSTYQSQLRQLSYQARMGSFTPSFALQENTLESTYSKGKQTKVSTQVKMNYFNNQFATLFIDKKFLTNENNAKNNYDNLGFGLNNTNLFLKQKLILTQSLRSDEYDAYQDKVTGNLGAKFLFTNTISLAANMGTGYRAPSLAELSYASVPVYPETKESYDITLALLGLELTYFNSKIDREIDYDNSIGSYGSYTNFTGSSKYQGFEASYKINFGNIQTNAGFNYTAQTAKDDNNQWLARRPEQQAGLTLDNYSLNNTHLGLSTRYIGKVYDKANQAGAQVGEYFVTDLTADYQATQHVNVFAKVENLFNQDYTTAVAAYQADGVTPSYVYANGGTQLFVGVKGSL